ncbi:MAG: RNA polymerase sigma factor region1.1 domain-containing protein, partial [Alphaproteobacteria bacterium]
MKASSVKAPPAKAAPTKAPETRAPEKPAIAKAPPEKTAADKAGKTATKSDGAKNDGRSEKTGQRRELMAKTEATKRKPAAEAADGPLLDMNDATVKKFIKAAKTRGFVTYDELNKVLPSDQNSS